jgi:hypothetical protein
MFLDGAYFRGELTLPQYGRLPQTAAPGEVGYQITQTVGENTLEWFIDRYEPEFLQKLMGVHLYESFIDGLKAETPLEIWAQLKERIYMQHGGIKLSPAANYVYFFAMRAAHTSTTMTGEKQQNGTFTNNVTPIAKQVKAWNDMCDAVYHIRQWMYEHKEDIRSALPDDSEMRYPYIGVPRHRFWHYWKLCFNMRYYSDFATINEWGI